MSNLSNELLDKFKEKGYRLSFENAGLVLFEVPIWDDEGVTPKYIIGVLRMSTVKGEFVYDLFNKSTNEELKDESITTLVLEAAMQKGWISQGEIK